MMFTLDKKSIDYIEERRLGTKNHDVIFTFYLTLTVLMPSIKIGDFRSQSPKEDASLILSSPNNPSSSDPNLDILVLYDKDNIKDRLFFEKIIDVKRSYVIPSSNWVNEFQEYIGLGKFLIVEIPELTWGLGKIDESKLTHDQKEFKTRIEKAFYLLKDIDKDMKEGEWGDAVKSCRDAMEPFTKNLTPLIKELIVKTTGIEEKNANQLTSALDNLFGFTSSLHHQITKSGTVANPFTGGKEDAFMAYMLTSGLVNSLARKFLRIVK